MQPKSRLSQTPHTALLLGTNPWRHFWRWHFGRRIFCYLEVAGVCRLPCRRAHKMWTGPEFCCRLSGILCRVSAPHKQWLFSKMNDCDYRYQRWLLVHFVNWGITGKSVYMNGPKSLLLMLWGSLPILSCLQAQLQQAHFCPVSVMCLQQET